MRNFKVAGVAVVAGVLAGALSVASAAPGYSTASTATSVETAIIVYDQPNFKGRALTFQRSVPSLAAVDFNDRVASLMIRGTRDWVLCENRNFMGRCVRVRAKANDLRLLQIAGRVSSLYPVPAAPPAPPKVGH